MTMVEPGRPPEATLQPPPPVLAEVVLVVVEVEVDSAPLALGPGGTEDGVPLPALPSAVAPAPGGAVPPSVPPSARAATGPWVGGSPLLVPASWVVSSAVPLLPPSPPPPAVPPRVLPVGDWQVLLATDVPVAVEVAVGLSGGTERTEPASTAVGTPVATGGAMATQVQSAGQSASVAQVAVFNWQVPGYEVEVVQTGWPAAPASVAEGGTGRSHAPDPPPVPALEPPLAAPVPAEPPPVAPGPEAVQVPRVVGWQAKPSPQSPSALQGKLHRYAQLLTVDSEQVGASAGVGTHAVFGGHSTGAGAPPVHVVTVSL
jgi:hypothetical protein